MSARTVPLISLVAGARPNFMKIAPIIRALEARRGKVSYQLVHTGQHYDRDMNDVFFEELGIPKPDVNLEVGSGSHAVQTANIMMAFEKYVHSEKPDLVLVVGDVNSTLACSIVSKKCGIEVAHVEAGLRSGDRSMPEEINRVVTDALSDYFFVTEKSGIDNLRREGISDHKLYFVGHVMIDNLFCELGKPYEELNPQLIEFRREHTNYGVVTLHRPSNVDIAETLEGLASALRHVSQQLPLIFPMHPRTAEKFNQFGIELGTNVLRVGPLGYRAFLNLWKDAAIVITDSGGLQEETTALSIPCVTVRESTERPATIESGSNILAGTDPKRIIAIVNDVLGTATVDYKVPELWDGRAAVRIVDAILDRIDGGRAP